MCFIKSALRSPVLPTINALYVDLSNIGSNGNASHTFERLDNIIQFIQPTHYILLVNEGCFPIQKRFKKKKVLTLIKPTGKFSSSITDPTIDFYKKIEEKIKNSPAWQKPKVIFSSSNVPGETDHKIFEFAREIQNEIKLEGKINPDDFVHAVISNDGDMSFLGLASHLMSFFVITERDKIAYKSMGQAGVELGEKNDFEKWCALYTNLFGEIIYKMMTGDKPNLDTAEGKELYWHVIDDFVFIMMFLGNDYMSGGSDYSTCENYRNIFGKGFITEGNDINTEVLANYLRKASYDNDSKSGKDPKAYLDSLIYTYRLYRHKAPNYSFTCEKPVSSDRLIMFLDANPGYKPKFAPNRPPPPIMLQCYKGFSPQIPEPLYRNLTQTLKITEETTPEDLFDAVFDAIAGLDEYLPCAHVKTNQIFEEHKGRWIPIPVNVKRLVRGFEDVPPKRMPRIFDPLGRGPLDFYDDGNAHLKKALCKPLKEYNGLIGRIVLVGWPQIYPAMVIQVADENERIIIKANEASLLPQVDITTKLIDEGFHTEIVPQLDGALKLANAKKKLNSIGIDVKDPKILLYVRPVNILSSSLRTYCFSLRTVVYPLECALPVSMCPSFVPLFDLPEVKVEVGMTAVSIGGKVVGVVTKVEGSQITIHGRKIDAVEFNRLAVPSQMFLCEEVIKSWFDGNREKFNEAFSLLCCDEDHVRFDEDGNPKMLSLQALSVLSLSLEVPTKTFNGIRLWPRPTTTQIEALKENLNREAKKSKVTVIESNSRTIVPGRRYDRIVFPDVGDRVVYIAFTGVIPFGATGVVVENQVPLRRIVVILDEEQKLLSSMGDGRHLKCYAGDVLVLHQGG